MSLKNISVFITLYTAWSIATYANESTVECDIPGEPIQWVADYCMASLGTDDEIAASDCIAEESQKEFMTSCIAKEHFKMKLCEIIVQSGGRSGSVDTCINDPTFAGSTVRNNGVGTQ